MGLSICAAPAGGFAGMGANAAADAGQRVGTARVLVGFLETAFGNEADVTPGVGVRRAGHHAGEVGDAASPHPPAFLESASAWTVLPLASETCDS